MDRQYFNKPMTIQLTELQQKQLTQLADAQGLSKAGLIRALLNEASAEAFGPQRLLPGVARSRFQMMQDGQLS